MEYWSGKAPLPARDYVVVVGNLIGVILNERISSHRQVQKPRSFGCASG
jgi:hypothetical protein